MNKMKFETPDLTSQNIDRIAALFPNCVTEMRGEDGKIKRGINFEMLKQMLSPDVVDGDECYEFTWVGKKASIVEANKPIRKTLRPCPEESKNWDTTENLYIEGDNLEVLKLLQEAYLGKVKMIYIDPPYNTGSDSFVYPDNFSMERGKYEAEIGLYNEDGNKTFRENNDTNPRFHSDWCSMVYSRLMLARNLLADDGVIFLSIDDNELDNLKKICDDVFGAACYINLITVKTKESSGASGGGEDRRLKKNIEYVLCYGKTQFKSFNAVFNKVELGQYLKTMDATGKSFKYTTVFTSLGERKYYKTIKDGSGADIHIFSHSEYETKSIKKLAQELKISELDVFDRYLDRICTTENAQTSIRTRVKKATDNEDTLYSIDYYPVSGKNKGQLTTVYFVGPQKRLVSWFCNVCERENGKIFKKEKLGTLWTNFNWNNVAREGEIPFPNGKKSLDFIKQLGELVTSSEGNDIVLDFFSGSATTAHAAMQLNAEDSGHRKFIMVQLPEPCDEQSEAYKAGYKTICEIGKERIRRAGEKIRGENPLTTQDLDVGFRVLKLDESNMKDVYYAADDYDQRNLIDMISNIKEDRTDLDLLFGCLLDWGLPLSLPYTSEQIDGCTVHTYNDGDLIACFDPNVPEGVVKEIAKRKPLRAVFRDSSFADSPAKINVFEIFKLYMPEDADDISKRVRVI